jgi:hypothetical protein
MTPRRTASIQHPRITLFTSFNRGMRPEAIAALPGHQKTEMTLIYARIANQVVAGEYAAASAKIDALHGQPPALPADHQTTGMARPRRQAHAPMPGNGPCTHPPNPTAAWNPPARPVPASAPAPRFPPILTRQRDHARDNGQNDRAELFSKIIQNLEQAP